MQLPGRGRHAATQRPESSPVPTARPTAVPDSPASPDGEGGQEEQEGRDAEGGLPRRVRQASLAPELRKDDDTNTSPQPSQSPTVRSPEAARATMASLRSGRRRASASASRDEPAGPGTPGPSPDHHAAHDEGFRDR
ncbi:hypothetical protein [Streptomyces sp. NPDC057302]|uniref:hypothetical protein n=1 Tax=Streptomyces sp. NPDC057302 TaxID=3346094 RepID=UPI003632D1AB